jgi:hypothetical protein
MIERLTLEFLKCKDTTKILFYNRNNIIKIATTKYNIEKERFNNTNFSSSAAPSNPEKGCMSMLQ